MPWKTVAFEREHLYQQVWAAPVRTIAKQYEISDVGLRKICVKLGVPLPPLGYWAKVAAGKTTRIPPLPQSHRGPTRHVRDVRISNQDDEKSQRIAAALAGLSIDRLATPSVKPDLAAAHPAVARTAKRIGQRRGLSEGLLEARGQDVFTVSVSGAQLDRALRILNAVVGAALASGAELVAAKKDGRGIHLLVHGEIADVRLEEEVSRSQREATPAEKARQAHEYFFKPDLWVYTPTGKLKLVIQGRDRYTTLVTCRDGRAPLEQRLSDVLPRLWRKIAELQVQAALRTEEQERWRQAAMRREALEARRSAALARLKQAEESASQWRRANWLREYAGALEGFLSRNTAAEPATAEITWLRSAADWLDPLVRSPWSDMEDEHPTAGEL